MNTIMRAYISLIPLQLTLISSTPPKIPPSILSLKRILCGTDTTHPSQTPGYISIVDHHVIFAHRTPRWQRSPSMVKEEQARTDREKDE
jgi:hypothetical protein